MTFDGIDPAKLQRIQEKLQAQGILIASNKGSATAKGITISWVYSPDTAALIVSVDKRTWFDPSMETIEQDIQQWISSC